MNDDNDPGAKPDSDDSGVPPAPKDLPPARARASRRGPTRTTIGVSIEVVTPILGGAAQTREVDEIDVIRPASIRGHLRFWWRALHGHQYENAADLYRAESEHWGHAATEHGGRSAVDLRIKVLRAPAKDTSTINMSEIMAYALWPARADSAPRRPPGTRFELVLEAPVDHEADLRDVVRAWLLFGGYGSRTRRGLGSLCVTNNLGAWLPAVLSSQTISQIFQTNVFSPPGKPATDTPWLAGAALQVSEAVAEARTAWLTALSWLKEFRQGTASRAREPGSSKPLRPSLSNWPEADKIRQLSRSTRGPWTHRPRHNEIPVWPRAGFGLPIVGEFQTKGRDGSYMNEPAPFELRWRFASPAQRIDDEQIRDRLASPLIVKPLPLADGKFAPCALWLHRAYPPASEVVLWRKEAEGARNTPLRGRAVRGSAAQFNHLVARGDRSLFAPLNGKTSLRDAFLDWLEATYRTTRIAP